MIKPDPITFTLTAGAWLLAALVAVDAWRAWRADRRRRAWRASSSSTLLVAALLVLVLVVVVAWQERRERADCEQRGGRPALMRDGWTCFAPEVFR